MSLYIAHRGASRTSARGLEIVRQSAYGERSRELPVVPIIEAIRLADTDRDWYDWIMGDELVQAFWIEGFENDADFERYCDEYADYAVAIGDLNHPYEGRRKSTIYGEFDFSICVDIFDFIHCGQSTYQHPDRPDVGKPRVEGEDDPYGFDKWQESKRSEVEKIYEEVGGCSLDGKFFYEKIPGVLGAAWRFKHSSAEFIYELKKRGASRTEIVSALEALHPNYDDIGSTVDMYANLKPADRSEEYLGRVHRHRNLALLNVIRGMNSKEKIIEFIYAETSNDKCLRAIWEMSTAIERFVHRESANYVIPSKPTRPNGKTRNRRQDGQVISSLLYAPDGAAFLDAYEKNRQFVLDVLESGYASIWTLHDNYDLFEIWADAYESGVDLEDIMNGYEHGEIVASR